MKVYADFGFSEISLKIALRPEKRLGDDDTWDKAEGRPARGLGRLRRRVAGTAGRGRLLRPEDRIPPARTRSAAAWQVGTMQVDFMMPGRLGAEYVDEDSSRESTR